MTTAQVLWRDYLSKNLYTKLAEINHLYYKYYFPHQKIADSTDKFLKQYHCKKIVFFGGFLDTAQLLQNKGYEMTFVDYTDEMVDEAKKVLKNMDFVTSDMRDPKLSEKQDAIILIGRIMTYMYTDEDVLKSLRAFKDNLNPGGIVIVDNYETGKIDKDQYFNGKIIAKGQGITINRISKMSERQKSPNLYRWDGIYEKVLDSGEKESYEDSDHTLRAFTKDEFQKLVEESGLKFKGHYPNFESKSFITIAQESRK